MNKKGLELSFGWIFAIVVGTALIVLAIYASVKINDTQLNIQNSEAAKEFGILLNPVESSIESGKKTMISFPVKTRIFNNCDFSGNFGVQKISTSTESSGKWSKPGVPSSFQNKYMFSSSTLEGKNFNVFTKTLNLPFKVADLIYIYSIDSKYCFVNAPDFVKDDVESLELSGINFTESTSSCIKGSTKVCFGNTGCDIEVDISSGSVRKNKQKIYYADDPNMALMYGAIFSDTGLYECQIKRIMKRTSELSGIYSKKSTTVSQKGCSSNLEIDLGIYSNMTKSLNNSNQIPQIFMASKELQGRNNALGCRLF